MGRCKQINGMDIREELFQGTKQRLEELAHRAIHKKNLLPEEFIIVCINVDDPGWTELADYLMPNHNWQQYRDKGQKPIARGSASAEICEFLSQVVPGIKDALYREIPEGHVRAVVMDGGGASMYYIRPVPEKNYH